MVWPQATTGTAVLRRHPAPEHRNLRRDLEYRPVPTKIAELTAAYGRRAVEIAVGAEDQSGIGVASIHRGTVEGRQKSFVVRLPSEVQLEYRPAAAAAACSVATGKRCAVEIAVAIEDQAGLGILPVQAVVVEVMQTVPVPQRTQSRGRGQLKHCTEAIPSALICRAVEVPIGIEGQACHGRRPVQAAEIMQTVRVPLCTRRRGRGQLKHRTAAFRAGSIAATTVRCAVEVPSRIELQAGNGTVPVLAGVGEVEVMQDLLVPLPVHCAGVF